MSLDPDPDPHSQWANMDPEPDPARQMNADLDPQHFTFPPLVPTSAKSSTEGYHIFEDSSLQPPRPSLPYPLEHFTISGSEDGQHPGYRRGG